MGRASSFTPHLLFVGLLYRDNAPAENVRLSLSERFGDIACESSAFRFEMTDYYAEELGEGLLRQYLAFATLVEPETLWQIKEWTNALEARTLQPETRSRLVNIDPGIMSAATVILASTKDFAHRIPLGGGIYGEVTLSYRHGRFEGVPWTYPDYLLKESLDFFRAAREFYRSARAASGKKS